MSPPPHLERDNGLSSTGSRAPLRAGKESVEVDVGTSPSTASIPTRTQMQNNGQPTFPEGGLQAWLTVIGGSMVLFCTFGVVQSFGVYQDYYTRVFLNEHTPSEISWIGSVQVFFLFALGLPAGKLFDEGYFHHTVISGSVIYLVSLFLLSLAKPHNYYQNFLAQGVGMGIGMGLMFLPSLTITSHYFRRRRSLAMGVVIAGSSLGGCLYPILLNNLFVKNDWGWGVRAVGFIDLGLLLMANLFMRTRLPSRKHKPDSKKVEFKTIIYDLPYMVFVAGSFLVFWGLFFPFFYLQYYGAQRHVSPTVVKYSITIMNAASVFGRTVPNFLADKYGPFNVMIPSTIISGGLIYAMFGASTTGGIIAFAIFYGFFSGGFVSICTPAASLFARDISELGIRIGVLSSSLGLALLTGNPIAGAVLSPPRYAWWRSFVFSSVVVFAGAACQILARSSLVKRKGSNIT
ncbi:hypothetical protein EYR40_001914 [Pleurotus pulmonarius]|nr:hypothetical protein EYR40_001914 [Pleurotus pulmonarius]KAF4607412.1 hypothetical protein EYR38_001483 [Pleurotus pulmonarius]